MRLLFLFLAIALAISGCAALLIAMLLIGESILDHGFRALSGKETPAILLFVVLGGALVKWAFESWRSYRHSVPLVRGPKGAA